MLTWALILLFAACEVGSSKFSYGKEADRLCAAYKKICPRGKMCAIQTIQWPRPMKFPVCVHEYAMQVRSRVCTEAPSPGGCAAQFRRWYYNVHMAACSWFTYGGCGGNGNNFRTKEECEKVCIEGREDSDDEGAATPANNQGVDDTSFDDSQEDRSRFINGRNDDTNGRHDDRENGRHRDINDDSDGQRGSDGYRYVGGDDHTYPYFPNPTKDNAARDYYATTVESQRGNSAAEASASAAGLPRRLPSASAYTDRGSVIFDDADLSRRERKNPPVAYSNGERRHSSAADRLSEIAVQAPSIHTVNVHRKVSNGRSHLSHPNAPGPVPLQMPRVLNLLQAPSRASDLTSVASGLNSAFEGRYAADGNETIRRFPKRKRKGGKGKKSRRRGGKSRNGRKGKKQRKTNSNKYPSHENTNSQLTNDVSLPHSFSDIDDNSQNSTAGNGRYHNQWNDASRRVAEFRQPQTGYWPEKIQSDEADQNAVSQSTTTTDQQPDDRKDKRGRRRRRRKGKKRQRGERRPTTERNEDRKGGRQYYPEKISLFGLLETPGSNETETPT